MRWPISPLSYVQCKAFHLNGVQTELKCKPNVKRCKRFVFVGHSPLLHHNTLKTKAITLFQADHILTRFVFPPLYTHPNAPLNDLYQDVVLNLWKAYPKFRKECKISTWIYRIALNTCISFYRKEKNVPEIISLTKDIDRTIEAHDPINEMLKQLYQMINQLGQLDKSIILLYLEDKSYEEIAEITGLTVTNIATKLSRIKDKLKRMKKEE